MGYKEISKSGKENYNLLDYDLARKKFNWWNDAFNKMDWLPGGGLNNAFEAVDRHVINGKGDKLAMIWVGKNQEEEKYTYLELKQKSDNFGAVMRNLGIKRGDKVFIFMDRLPELYISALGILKSGGIIAPLFSAFGPDPVKDRMEDAGARYLITTPELRQKLDGILPQIKTLKDVIIVNKNSRYKDTLQKGDLSYEDLMQSSFEDKFEIEHTTQYDFAIMHYTSGSTGKPKGVLHRHQAVIQQWLTGKLALDFTPEDIYFCTADPGLVTGTSYGILAPWTNGVTQLIYEGGFGAQSWYKLIEKYKVNIWYTAPTAVRLLMRAGG